MTLTETQAKGIVAIAFRNGPLEGLHAQGKINEGEMRDLMKWAVDAVTDLLRLQQKERRVYNVVVTTARQLYAAHWDAPDESKSVRAYAEHARQFLKGQDDDQRTP